MLSILLIRSPKFKKAAYTLINAGVPLVHISAYTVLISIFNSLSKVIVSMVVRFVEIYAVLDIHI